MKAKKVIIALLLSLATIFNCAGALAAEVVPPVQPAAVKDDGVASPQTEETVWCRRFHEGHWQKRLWSITNGCWLTEWENID